MIDLLLALHLWRVVRKVLVDGEGKMKGAALIHSLIRIDCQGKVEYVIRVGKRSLHRPAEGAFQLLEV